MLRDINLLYASGSIFWSKLDERETFSILKLGLDLGDGKRVFTSISNPNEKAHNFTKAGNKAIILGGWFDIWTKKDGSQDLQIKGYDSNIQFYLPDAVIPALNDVTIYGKVEAYESGIATIDCIGGKNPKTSEYTHRKILMNIGNDRDDPTGKKIFIKGSLDIEKIGDQSKVRIIADYDNISVL